MTTVTAADARHQVRVPTAVLIWSRTRLAALVGAVVVGILGMHGLADHGNPAAVAAAASVASSPAPSGVGTRMSTHDAAMVSGTSHDGHAHAGDETGDAAGAGDDTHDMAGMVTLCVVMLAAAALTLVALLAVAIRRPLLPAAFAPAAVRERVVQWVRGTGPPPVWEFSVIRC